LAKIQQYKAIAAESKKGLKEQKQNLTPVSGASHPAKAIGAKAAKGARQEINAAPKITHAAQKKAALLADSKVLKKKHVKNIVVQQ